MKIRKHSTNPKETLFAEALRSVIKFHEELDRMMNASFKGDQQRAIDAARENWHRYRDKVKPLLNLEET